MPYLRLSGFYFFYFALLGALVPYWSLYLKDFQLSAEEIGFLMALIHVSRILAPNLWGWLADVSGQRLRIIRYGAGLTWLIFLGIFWQDSFWGFAWVMLGFSFFWNAVLPQCEVLTLQHLGERREGYSRIRVWGSVGFVLAVLGVGALLDWLGLRELPWILLILMALIWLNSLSLPAPAQNKHPAPSLAKGHFLKRLSQPQVMIFFLVFFLVQFSHGPYYTFFSVLLQEMGLSASLIGLLWSLGVVAEILLFIYMPRLMRRFNLRQLMLSSLLLTVLRWSLIAFWPEVWPLLLFAQILHAASFGSLHAVGIALVQRYFCTATQGRGQALFSSAGFGAGGAAGALLSGWAWDLWGSLWVFAVAALISLLALLLAYLWIYPEKVPSLDK